MAFAQRDRGRRPVAAIELADQHVGAVAGEHDFGERAGEAGAGLDDRDQRARGEIDALQHALPVETDFAREPVRLVGIEEGIIGQHLRRIAFRLEHDDGDVALVGADIEDRVVEFAREPQRPEIGAELLHVYEALAGGGRSGPRSVMVAIRSARLSDTETD